MLTIMFAALAAASPGVAPAAPMLPPVVAAPAPPRPTGFDVVPADIDPARLALARQSVGTLFPPGSYARMFGQMMGPGKNSLMNSMIDMSPADMGLDAGGQVSMRDLIAKKDPYFQERIRLTTQVITEEMTRLAPQFEPPLREGLARSMSRRFSAAQLADLNVFLSTPSGRAFGEQMFTMWVDPEVIRSMISIGPMMMKEMPAVMKKVEAATASLPKSPSQATAAKVTAPPSTKKKER